MSAQKSARKSASSAPGKPFKKGRDSRRGKGPEKGAPNAGRPPNWLRDWCDDLLANPKAKKAVEEILNDSDHSAFASMWKAIADRAHGKPPQSVTHDVGATLEDILTKSREK